MSRAVLPSSVNTNLAHPGYVSACFAAPKLQPTRHRRRAAAAAAQQQEEQQIPQEAERVLASVRVVLVAPKTPANIGAVARVCANFEAPSLWLVSPRCDAADGEIAKVASGAEEVVQNITVVEGLQDALADTVGSVGFTRRAGATRYTHGSIAEMLDKYPSSITALDPALQQQLEQLHQQQEPVPHTGVTALVFGREESGLSESELRLCSQACAIPTGRMQASMNLSHAVAVVLSGLFERRLALLGFTENPGLEFKGSPAAREALQPAAASEVSALLGKVSSIAEAVGLSGADSRGGGAQGSHGRRRLPVGHIRALLSRAQINAWEVRSLHGLASAVLGKVQTAAEADANNEAVSELQPEQEQK